MTYTFCGPNYEGDRFVATIPGRVFIDKKTCVEWYTGRWKDNRYDYIDPNGVEKILVEASIHTLKQSRHV
jgi:hypothetical protein